MQVASTYLAFGSRSAHAKIVSFSYPYLRLLNPSLIGKYPVENNVDKLSLETTW